MELDFLTDFTKRMKSIGAYGLLFKNSSQKGTWKQYNFDTFHEQTNLIFSVLLYIMEQSLKDETCTIDDIGNFIDTINMKWYKKSISYEECKQLGDFIVNVILCDEGKAMYFQGFDYEKGKYEDIHISFIANKIIYVNETVRRTSYYLTEEGYNLLLSTLEVEGNMKLTIHEMIFKLHMEKASYDKAVDDIKHIFNLLRIQLQRIQEVMRTIRQNALQFTVAEYSRILEENLATIDDTKTKFATYKEHVRKLVENLEQQDIHVEKLKEKESDNLKNLKTIEGYINRALDEYQKILLAHFDLKALYTKELEDLSQMSFIKRFSLRNDLYQQVLKDPTHLERLDIFLRPLFNQDMKKTYHIGKAFEYQKSIKLREIEEGEELEDFDDKAWRDEQKKKQEEKLMTYKESLRILLQYTCSQKKISLKEIKENLTEEDKPLLFPTLEVFREIMIELIKNREFVFAELLKEQEEHFAESTHDFQINLCLLEVIQEGEAFRYLKKLEVQKEDGEIVEFPNIITEQGQPKKIRCSNVVFRLE